MVREFSEDDHDHDVSMPILSVQIFTVPSLVGGWAAKPNFFKFLCPAKLFLLSPLSILWDWTFVSSVFSALLEKLCCFFILFIAFCLLHQSLFRLVFCQPIS